MAISNAPHWPSFCGLVAGFLPTSARHCGDTTIPEFWAETKTCVGSVLYKFGMLKSVGGSVAGVMKGACHELFCCPAQAPLQNLEIFKTFGVLV